MVPEEIMVGLPRPPWLQVVREQLHPKSCERSRGFSTIPAATYPVPLLVGCPKHYSLDLAVFLIFVHINPSYASSPAFSLTSSNKCPQILPMWIHPFFFIPGELCILFNSRHHSLSCKSCGCVSLICTFEVLRGGFMSSSSWYDGMPIMACNIPKIANVQPTKVYSPPPWCCLNTGQLIE